MPEQAGSVMRATHILGDHKDYNHWSNSSHFFVKTVKGNAVSPSSSSAIPLLLSRSGVQFYPTCFKVVAELFTGAFSVKEFTDLHEPLVLWFADEA